MNSRKNKLNNKISWFFNLEPNAHKISLLLPLKTFTHIKIFISHVSSHKTLSLSLSLSHTHTHTHTHTHLLLPLSHSSSLSYTFSSGLLTAWRAAEKFYAEGFGFLFDNISLCCPCVCISLPLSLPFIFYCGCDFKLA